MVERQCVGWPDSYFVGGPFGLKIWSETNPLKGNVLSYTIGAWEDRPPMTIWMDGRPHPSKYAEHTRAGFTTGVWEGNTLVTHTTHMKAGLPRRTDAPNSDEATLTMRFYRSRGSYDYSRSRRGSDLPCRTMESCQHLSSERTACQPHRAAVPSAYEGSIGSTVPCCGEGRSSAGWRRVGVPLDAVVSEPGLLIPTGIGRKLRHPLLEIESETKG